ncbi:MAG: hypothetical protein AB1724_05130 [Thermodesulfobacteriota bacterium]
MLIRWIPCELPFLAFFRSLVLLACFLGLGLGCIAFSRIKVSKGTLIALFLTGLLIGTITIRMAGEDLRARGFGKNSGIYQQTGESADRQRNKPDQLDFTIEFEGTKGLGEFVIIGVFIFVSLLMVPIGVIIARCFCQIPPLQAYLINISGAISGSIAFIVISFTGLSPEFWFAIGLLPCVFLVSRNVKKQAPFWVMVCAVFFIVWQHVNSTTYPVIWSPYQRVSCNFWYVRLSGFPLDLNGRHLMEAPVFVNYDYHQSIMDYSYAKNADPEGIRNSQWALDTYNPRTSIFYRTYTTPYRYKPHPERVLIIGAGVGNEAAAAIRAGVPEIDAVEIDPGIVEMGVRYHPERPYANPHVNVIRRDARSFLEQTDKQYDLIVKNIVDSHTQFAASAGLRLDSYIMTMEFFEQIRRHLKPDGLFAMEFSGYHWSLPWTQARIREILWRVFGFSISDPAKLVWGGGPMLLIGKGSPPPKAEYDQSIPVSTDDWPQFFLKKPMIPRAYLFLILSVMLISLVGITIANPRSLKQVDAHFLLLGAAFMMLEIKSITELSLILGADWLVNSIVIVGVLIAVGLSNMVILLYPRLPYWPSYLIIFASLALGFVFHPGFFLGYDFPTRGLAGILRVALPVFGAGLVFSSSFRQATNPPVALGWNLLGAMIGGLGEYLSLITGVRLLGAVIILLYLLSLPPVTRHCACRASG